MNDLQSYSILRELAPDVYVMEGEWYNTPLRRRMTVIRLKSGFLLVHSAIRLRELDYAWIDKLGKVKYIVVPNFFHNSEAHYYAEKYPEAHVLVARSAVKSTRKLCRIDGVLPLDWPIEIQREIECLELQGTRLLGECVFLHKPSCTLVVTDLVFNLHTEVQGGEKVFFQLNDVYKKFGTSRIFRWVIQKNGKALSASVQKILHWNFERIVMNHGEIIEKKGKERFIEAMRFLPKPMS